GEKEADDKSHSGEASKKEKAATATASSKRGTAAVNDEWDEEREPKTLKQLKSSFAEFYRSLVLLQNYQDLNVKGFKRLMFKSDKMFKSTAGEQWYKDKVEKAQFFHTKDVDDLISRVEQFVTLHLVEGDKNLAMKILRIPPLNEIQSAWTTGRLGFFGGTFVSLCLFLLLFHVFNRDISDEPKWLIVRLFRGHFLVFFNIFLISINVFGWQTNGINHILIFEIDPREHLTYQGLMEISFMLLTLWAVCALGYVSSRQTSVPATFFPLSLTIISLSWLVFPLPIFNRPSRWWFVKRLFYVCSPPFHFVAFADFWLADQMNSLTTVFLDLQYTICFYYFYVDYGDRWSIRYLNNAVNNQTLSVVDKVGAYSWEGIDRFTGVDACVSHIYGIRPLVSCIPAILRLAQCLRRWYDSGQYSPHVYNAGKYSTTFFIVFFGWLNSLAKSNWNQRSFYYPWVLAYVVGYIYAFIWDIKMDWSLFDRHGDDLIYIQKEGYPTEKESHKYLSLDSSTFLQFESRIVFSPYLTC
uniref:Xenotropic and polytropic retrovirus receptor 1 n=1 Tax=Romanomermis culicivorax TaxID=13658 RepID=A0A915J450_ROMCU